MYPYSAEGQGRKQETATQICGGRWGRLVFQGGAEKREVYKSWVGQEHEGGLD